MIPIIDIKKKIKELGNRAWFPLELAKFNDQVIRIALCKGAYPWHKHDNEDELFYVLEGELTIQMKKPYSTIILKKGELAVIPKGVKHSTKSSIKTYILMFEPHSLKTSGD